MGQKIIASNAKKAATSKNIPDITGWDFAKMPNINPIMPAKMKNTNPAVPIPALATAHTPAHKMAGKLKTKPIMPKINGALEVPLYCFPIINEN